MWGEDQGEWGWESGVDKEALDRSEAWCSLLHSGTSGPHHKESLYARRGCRSLELRDRPWGSSYQCRVPGHVSTVHSALTPRCSAMVDSWAICQLSLIRPAGSSGFSVPSLGYGFDDSGGLESRMSGRGAKSQPALLPLQRSERPSKSLTAMAMASSPSRNWALPCAPWATCLTRWSWKLSSSD